MIVDGNSRKTDLLGYRLERDLPIVAEGRVVGGWARRNGRGSAAGSRI